MEIKRQEIDAMCLFLFGFYSYLPDTISELPSIDLCPQKIMPPPCAALIPPIHVVTKDTSMLPEHLPRFFPTQVPG
jgi:hypothetical protein